MHGTDRTLKVPGISWHDYNALLQAQPEPSPVLPGFPPAGQDSRLARAVDLGRLALSSRIKQGERLSNLRGEFGNLALAEDVLLGE